MDISAYITPVPNMSYWVVMVDYGPKPKDGIGPYGYEAIVHPEDTKRKIVDYIREVVGDGICIAHIKRVEGNHIEDVTLDLVSEAINEMALEAAE